MTPTEIKTTALYKFCLHAYQEHAAWVEDEQVFSEGLKHDHDEIRDYLSFTTEREGDKIRVSFLLNESDTTPMSWQSQVSNAVNKE